MWSSIIWLGEIGEECTVWQVHWWQPIIWVSCNRTTWTSVHFIFNDPPQGHSTITGSSQELRLSLVVPTVGVPRNGSHRVENCSFLSRKASVCTYWFWCMWLCRGKVSGTVVCIDFFLFMLVFTTVAMKWKWWHGGNLQMWKAITGNNEMLRGVKSFLALFPGSIFHWQIKKVWTYHAGVSYNKNKGKGRQIASIQICAVLVTVVMTNRL